MPCMLKTGVKPGPNHGKSFYICAHSSERCSFVKECDMIGLIPCNIHPGNPIDLRGFHTRHGSQETKLFYRCAAVRGMNQTWCGHKVVEKYVKPLGDATLKVTNVPENSVNGTKSEQKMSESTSDVRKSDGNKGPGDHRDAKKLDISSASVKVNASQRSPAVEAAALKEDGEKKPSHSDVLQKKSPNAPGKTSDFASLAQRVPQAQRLQSDQKRDHNSSFSGYRDSPSVKGRPAGGSKLLSHDSDSESEDSVEILDDSRDSHSGGDGNSSFTKYRDGSSVKLPSPAAKADAAADGNDSCVIIDDEDEEDGHADARVASAPAHHHAADAVSKVTSNQPPSTVATAPSAQPEKNVTKLVIPRDSDLSRDMRLKDDLARQLKAQQHLLASVKMSILPDGGRKIRGKIDELTQQIAALDISIQSGQKTLINEHLKQQGKPALSSAASVMQPKQQPTMGQMASTDGAASRPPSSSSSQPCSVSGQSLLPGQKQTLITHHTQPLPAHVFQQMYAANPQAMTLYGGRMTNARLREVGSVTTEAIERLHKQLETCPEATSEEEDPKGVKVPLMTHQRQAIKWLLWRENQQPPGGILADDMGLGKTLTMISLVLNSKLARLAIEKEEEKEDDDDEESNSDDNDSDYKKKKNSKEKSEWLSKSVAEGVMKSNATLIICPASLVHQWEKEIEKRVKRGLLKVIMYHGPNREPDINKLAKADIVLTTYSIICREIPISEEMKKDKAAQDMPAKDKDLGSAEDAKSEPNLLRIGWERIILDEGHSIKNHKSLTAMSVCRLRSGKRWVLSGTPIQNDLLDMYSLLRFLRCSPFDEYKLWKRQVDNKSEKGKQRLNVLVKALLLRRTKDQKGEHGKALVALPSRHTFSHELELAADERRIYDKIFAQSRSMMQSYIARHEEKALEKQLMSGQKTDNPFNKTVPSSSGGGGGAASAVTPGFSTATQMLSSGTQASTPSSSQQPPPSQKPHAGQMLLCLLRLRQCCGHLSLMKAAPDVEAMETDGLQLDLVQQMTELALAEQKDTMDPSKAKDPTEIFEVHNTSSKINFLVEKLKEIKEESPKKKPLKSVVVSQWTKMLDVAEYHLKDADISCCTIRGNIPPKQRSEIVDRFNNDPSGPQNNQSQADIAFVCDSSWVDKPAIHFNVEIAWWLHVVMLLSLRAGGVGLNLVGGNSLFLLDMHWNPALEAQACDRIYRMGQTREVNIHRFVCKDTVETKILALQQSKLKLAKNVLTGDGASANKLTLQDLKMLFGLDQPAATAAVSAIPYSNYSQKGSYGHHGNPSSSSSQHSNPSSRQHDNYQPRPATFHGNHSKPTHGSYLGSHKHPSYAAHK